MTQTLFGAKGLHHAATKELIPVQFYLCARMAGLAQFSFFVDPQAAPGRTGLWSSARLESLFVPTSGHHAADGR